MNLELMDDLSGLLLFMGMEDFHATTDDELRNNSTKKFHGEIFALGIYHIGEEPKPRASPQKGLLESPNLDFFELAPCLDSSASSPPPLFCPFKEVRLEGGARAGA